MGIIKKIGLATLLIAVLPIGTSASASTIEDFYGRWVGKGIAENKGLEVADRDLDVTALSDKPEPACEGCRSEAFRPPAAATRPGRRNGSV